MDANELHLDKYFILIFADLFKWILIEIKLIAIFMGILLLCT